MTNNGALIEAVAGAAGAVVALVATYPLATVSTIQAVDKQVDDGQRKKTVSVLQDIFKIYQANGVGALFQGLQPAIIGTVVSQSIYFYLYAIIRAFFVRRATEGASKGGRRQEISVLASLLTAGLAGCGNVILTNPIWLVVTRMQTQLSSCSVYEVVRNLIHEDGISALWRGVAPSLVMVCNPTVQYAVYEWASARWMDAKRARAAKQYQSPAAVSLTSLEVFCLSAVAKLGATVSTYPLLVVKNRMQAESKPEEGRQMSSIYTTIVGIYKGEGVWGFFKGMRAKILQSILAGAILLSIKERLYDVTAASLRTLSTAEEAHTGAVRADATKAA